MSVIQKIRNKYAGVTIGLIVLAMIGFILMDAFSSRSSSLFGDDSSVAKVDGDKIDYLEYQRRVQEYEILYGSSQQGLDDNMRAQLQEQAVKDLVKENLINKEAEKLGLQTTEQEKKEMIYGANPDPAVRAYQPFTNQETGAFDPQYVKLFEQQANQLDPTGKAAAHWESMKSYIVRNAVTNKYNALFSGGAYVPSFIMKHNMELQKQGANIEYVSVGYDLSDEDIKVTDEEMIAYMKEHKGEYTVKQPTRSIEYVSFNVTPSADDTARALDVLVDIKSDFEQASDDESFVNRNSEESYAGSYVMKNTYMSAYSDSIFNMQVGQVYGPFFENNTYKLVKVTDKKVYPDSVKCRHILIKTQDQGQQVLSDSIASARMDSVVKAIKAGADFNEMVAKYSDDQGSINTGGEYTFPFTQKASLSKEFADFIFENKTGAKDTVKVQNAAYAGYHYMEILEQKNPQTAYKLATISKGLYAGDVTENEVYGSASAFASDNANAEAFNKAVKEGTYDKRVADNITATTFLIPGLGPSRELIRWAMNAEVGDVSPVFPVGKKYVVAKLNSVQEKGLMELNDNLRVTIAEEVKMKKKADQIVDQYKGKNSLSEIAAAANQEVMPADSINAATPFVGQVGYEPKLVGYIFNPAVKTNQMQTLKGQSAVIYFTIKNKYQTSAVDMDSTMIDRERQMQQSQLKGTMSSGIQESLKEDVKVKYNPNNF